MDQVNHTPELDPNKSTTGCCALIDTAEWDEREFVFENKPFAKAKVRSLFHIPLNMKTVMAKAQAAIQAAGAQPEEFLILSRELSPWSSEQLFAVTRDVPDMDTELLTGKFMAKVFEGPYSDAPKWHTALTDYVRTKGGRALETFFFYTTCPNCAKAYGKNYVVGFAKIA